MSELKRLFLTGGPRGPRTVVTGEPVAVGLYHVVRFVEHPDDYGRDGSEYIQDNYLITAGPDDGGNYVAEYRYTDRGYEDWWLLT